MTGGAVNNPNGRARWGEMPCGCQLVMLVALVLFALWIATTAWRWYGWGG